MRNRRQFAVVIALVAVVAVGCGESSAADLLEASGGHVCAAASSEDDLANVVLVGHRFALRKLTVSAEDVAFNRTIVDTYCPEHLPVFDAYVDGLKVDSPGICSHG